MFKEIEVRKIEDERVLNAITTLDDEDEKKAFWESSTFEAIVDEVKENGCLYRHPVYTDYVVDVILAKVLCTRDDKVNECSISEQNGRRSVSVRLHKNCYKRVYLSRFIMEAFLGEKLAKGAVVHHYQYAPDIPDCIHNLRLITQEQNCSEPHGPHKYKGARYHYWVYDADGECVLECGSMREIAEYLGVKTCSVQRHIENHQKTVGGCTVTRERRG